jgi:hypothetical protein
MKRTVLAGKARLNYSALIRYLKFLKTLRWVDFSSDSGSLISLTAIGRSFRKMLDREDAPQDISKEVLSQLAALAEEKPSTKAAGKEPNQSCLFCGNIIAGRAVSKEVDGVTYSFDKRECATLFSKFRDVYGKEFSL